MLWVPMARPCFRGKVYTVRNMMNPMPSLCSGPRVQLFHLSGAAQACCSMSLESQAPVGGTGVEVSAPTQSYPTRTKFMFPLHPDDSWGILEARELPRRPGWSLFPRS